MEPASRFQSLLRGPLGGRGPFVWQGVAQVTDLIIRKEHINFNLLVSTTRSDFQINTDIAQHKIEKLHFSTALPFATTPRGVPSQRLANLTRVTSNSGSKQPDTQHPSQKAEKIIVQIYHEYTKRLHVNNMQSAMLHQRDKEKTDMEEQIRYLHGSTSALENHFLET